MTSVFDNSRKLSVNDAHASVLSCVCMTPFGTPVEPLVKVMVAKSSGRAPAGSAPVSRSPAIPFARTPRRSGQFPVELQKGLSRKKRGRNGEPPAFPEPFPQNSAAQLALSAPFSPKYAADLWSAWRDQARLRQPELSILRNRQ